MKKSLVRFLVIGAYCVVVSAIGTYIATSIIERKQLKTEINRLKKMNQQLDATLKGMY